MARQLYDYWFVQFDFPDENGRPYKSSGGKMVWNEKLKREIPEGWEDKRLDSLAKIFTGKKDVAKVIPGPYKFFSCAPDPISSSEYIYDGDVILVSGNGSYTGRVMFYSGKVDLYQRTYGCINIDNQHNRIPFLYCTMKSMFEPYYSGGKHGSSIPYIVLDDLAGFRFAYHNETIEKFVKIISPVFYKFIFKENDETTSLINQRDEILPLLMNGQVSVMPQEVNCDLAVLILRRSSAFGSVLPNHLCATKGLDNQCSRFRTQGLLPRRMPHHSICKCGFWAEFFSF